jgi:hypothetical protein
MDCPGSCHRRHRGHWKRRGAERTTGATDAAHESPAATAAASHASHAAAYAYAKADAPRPDACAHAHATASKRWICASSNAYANAYATRTSFWNDGASSSCTNAHAKPAQRFCVACSNASDRQTLEQRNAKSSFCAKSTTSQRWRYTFTYACSASRFSTTRQPDSASLPDCAGHANTAETACHVR